MYDSLYAHFINLPTWAQIPAAVTVVVCILSIIALCLVSIAFVLVSPFGYFLRKDMEREFFLLSLFALFAGVVLSLAIGLIGPGFIPAAQGIFLTSLLFSAPWVVIGIMDPKSRAELDHAVSGKKAPLRSRARYVHPRAAKQEYNRPFIDEEMDEIQAGKSFVSGAHLTNGSSVVLSASEKMQHHNKVLQTGGALYEAELQRNMLEVLRTVGLNSVLQQADREIAAEREATAIKDQAKEAGVSGTATLRPSSETQIKQKGRNDDGAGLTESGTNVIFLDSRRSLNR